MNAKGPHGDEKGRTISNKDWIEFLEWLFGFAIRLIAFVAGLAFLLFILPLFSNKTPPVVTHTLTVRAMDSNEAPFYGTNIYFSVGGVQLGSVFSSSRRAQIMHPLSDAFFEIVTEFKGVSSKVTVPSSKTDVDMHLPTKRQAYSWSQSRVQCPDGTTGHPCVNCLVGGRVIHVCA